MYRGYIPLWRKFKDWSWYQDANVSRVFIHLLLSMNIEDKQWKDMIVKRGQLVTSVDHLKRDLSLSSQNIRTALDKLEKTGEINKQTTSRFSLITVLKVEQYDIRQQTTNKRLTNDQQQLKNVKKEKNEKNTYVVRSETQTLYDSIEEMCVQYDLEFKVNIKALDVLVERYVGKIKMKVEMQHCISWLVGREFRVVTTQRIGNWFKKALEIQKRDQLKQLEQNSKQE